MALRPCLGLPGQRCGRLTTRTDSRCTTCASARGRARDAARGSRHDRGYSADHVRERERWQPKVERGEVNCARCGQPIPADAEWALDHNEERTGYLGPSHKFCNNQAGGIAAHR